MSPKKGDLEYKPKILNVIKCECGTEILVVPDLHAMEKAIEAHVSEHCKHEKDSAKAVSESNRIWNLLAAAVFDSAAAQPVR